MAGGENLLGTSGGPIVLMDTGKGVPDTGFGLTFQIAIFILSSIACI